MKAMSTHEVFQALCRATGKWGLYISFDRYWENEDCIVDDLVKAAPYLAFPADGQVIMEGQGIILCDTEEERDRLFDQTVGDEGPTKLNPYNGPARVYALTCNPDGQLGNENT
jgi:hypothetical protein